MLLWTLLKVFLFAQEGADLSEGGVSSAVTQTTWRDTRLFGMYHAFLISISSFDTPTLYICGEAEFGDETPSVLSKLACGWMKWKHCFLCVT